MKALKLTTPTISYLPLQLLPKRQFASGLSARLFKEQAATEVRRAIRSWEYSQVELEGIV